MNLLPTPLKVAPVAVSQLAATARLVGGAAVRIHQSLRTGGDFRQALAGNLNERIDPVERLRDAAERVSARITRALEKNDSAANSRINLSFQADGRVRVDDAHPAAAAIEAALAAEPQLPGEVRQYLAAGGDRSMSLDLTPSRPAATMIARPGGYPNW